MYLVKVSCPLPFYTFLHNTIKETELLRIRSQGLKRKLSILVWSLLWILPSYLKTFLTVWFNSYSEFSSQSSTDIYIYIYTHIYTYIYIYTHIYTYIYTHIYTYIYIHIYTYVYIRYWHILVEATNCIRQIYPSNTVLKPHWLRNFMHLQNLKFLHHAHKSPAFD